MKINERTRGREEDLEVDVEEERVAIEDKRRGILRRRIKGDAQDLIAALAKLLW